MGIKKTCMVVVFCSLLVLSGCEGFYTAKLSLRDKNVIYAVANDLEAYYLTEDGILYSPGADRDASRFVLYQNKSKGIVAENVDAFGTMLNGGYYITEQNDLYMWNRYDLPVYNYENKDGHKKILQNVTFAKIYKSLLIYIDTCGQLCLAGECNGEVFSLSNPKKLAEDVRLADINDYIVFWIEESGRAGSYSLRESDIAMFSNILNIDMQAVDALRLTNSFAVFLKNGQLWFYGSYNALLGETVGEIELRVLSENILRFDCEQHNSDQTIVAIDLEHTAYVWGKCLSNDMKETKTPVFSYFEKQKVIDDVVQIDISGDNLCFITTDCTTSVFRREDQWGFCGNSTNDANVGIFREPVTWTG